jgi:hypothetical protein
MLVRTDLDAFLYVGTNNGFAKQILELHITADKLSILETPELEPLPITYSWDAIVWDQYITSMVLSTTPKASQPKHQT